MRSRPTSAVAADGSVKVRATALARSLLDDDAPGGADGDGGATLGRPAGSKAGSAPPSQQQQTKDLTVSTLDDAGWLSRCKVLIIDEAHERDTETDVLLGWVREALRANTDIRVVVCSATISASDFAGFFGGDAVVPTLRIAGRMYPVDIRHEPQSQSQSQSQSQQQQQQQQRQQQPGLHNLNNSNKRKRGDGSSHGGPDAQQGGRTVVQIGAGPDAASLTVVDQTEASRLQQRAVATAVAVICSPHSDNEAQGHVIVFLPGKEECDDAKNAFDASIARAVAEAPRTIADRARGAVGMVLYGALTLEAQLAATVESDPQNRRKVIFSTNVAETSLTIDGARVVIDAGMEKIARFDQRDGIDKLDLALASRSSCKQRAGRAGRVAPGVCHRMYSEADLEARAPYR
jgi:HrpA-like RNA helicase